MDKLFNSDKNIAKTIINTFNNLAKTYKNKFTSDEIEKQKIISLVEQFEIKPGFQLLEVGGGTGDLSPFLLIKLKSRGLLVFLDIALEMVRVARQKLSTWDNVEFKVDDIHHYKPKQLFDRIIVFNTFPHFYNKKTALTNCYRILKPGGKLVICHNESRMSICLHHVKNAISLKLSDFPKDSEVYKLLTSTGFKVELFENNEGYNYYLVIAVK
ncbi:MAG: class I SAM-dependent methyltransferase [Patescibacteria group bacterium]